ncbi:hypothetical protein BGX28_002746 [Mortierella sp. GBA30]|nr:hypothetical protein BGX28_002746 [Mortierella sp. GBA30]
MHVTSVSHDAINRGQNVCVTVNGKVTKVITSGTITIEANADLGVLKVPKSYTWDVCKESESSDSSCPIETGDQSLKYCFMVPSDMTTGPNGIPVDIVAHAKQQDGLEIFCAKGAGKVVLT